MLTGSNSSSSRADAADTSAATAAGLVVVALRSSTRAAGDYVILGGNSSPPGLARAASSAPGRRPSLSASLVALLHAKVLGAIVLFVLSATAGTLPFPHRASARRTVEMTILN